MAPDFTKLYGRWKAGEVRKEDKMPPFPKPKNLLDMTIIDEKNLLTDEQKEHLLESASLEFKLDGYTSLADMLNDLHVEVYILPGIVKRSTKYLDAAKEYWEKKLKSQKESEIACRNLQTINAELEAVSCECLRGCYIHEQKKILLFPEEMEKEKKYDGKCMNELLVSTLAHETMHAYFNRTGHDSFPYVYFVEEPLAEFGMLVFLKETGIPYLDWAYVDVHGKRTCYRYGASLYDTYNGGDRSLRDYLEKYKILINEFFIPDVVGESICLPTPTTPHRRSVLATSHSCGHSMYWTYKGVVYTLIAEYSTNSSKECIFCPKSNRGFINIPDPFGRHFSLLDSLNLSSKGHCGKHLSVKIIYGGVEAFPSGEASIFKQKAKYSMHLLDDFKHNFQSTFKHLEPKGVLLEVAFYKNVSEDNDWILMVK